MAFNQLNLVSIFFRNLKSLVLKMSIKSLVLKMSTMNIKLALPKKSLMILLFILSSLTTVQAQYFGQNRVRYKKHLV